MSSVQQFSVRAKNIKELPSPFGEALLHHLRPDENIRHLIFSPEYSAAKLRTPASVICVTNRRWLIASKQVEIDLRIDEATYNETLIVELTLILLYGQLKFDFMQNEEVQSTAIIFNTVMCDLYLEAIQDVLDAMDGIEDALARQRRKADPEVRDWPLKFQNVSITYTPRGSKLVDGVYWNAIYGGFGRELSPATALLLTDRHIILIAEEKSTSWFRSRREARYGEIITYLPLKRLAKFRLDPQSRFNILELEGHAEQGREKLEIVFPFDREEAVVRFLQKASAILIPSA
jgi:hypothetical protein